MPRNTPGLRFLGPIILTSFILLALCTLLASVLYRQQSKITEDLSENVGSRRAAADLESTLNELLGQLQHHDMAAATLHDRVKSDLRVINQFANKKREQELAVELEASFDRYLLLWSQLQLDTPREQKGKFNRASSIIAEETLRRCRELRDYNSRQIEDSERAHRESIQRLAWGLVAVGGAGAVAGLFLGYGVARGLYHTIRRLQVHVQDAAGKLGAEWPAIVLTEEGDLEQLHEQVEGLATQIEQVVERLRQREQEVLRAEQLAAVGQVAASVAHEIRNPLTSIKMLIQGASDAIDARPLSAEDLQIIEQEIRRMEQSLRTFLDFARPPRLERASLDLGALIERTLMLLRGRAARQHVALGYLPAAQPVIVEADGEQLKQVLVNLLLNSLDVLPRGGEIVVRLRQDVNGFAEVSVEDNGPGISPEMQPRMFTPFATSKETGLGLGLVVSRRIVEDHGGILEATNRSEGGATFRFRLPAQARTPASVEA